MSAFLGPPDADGRIPAQQQTRVAAFLMSAHAAQARQLAAVLPASLRHAWQLELHSQYCREMEIVSLLTRATTWIPDPQLMYMIWEWETAWLPKPIEGTADRYNGMLVDMAALGHALHAGIRPAAVLPEGVAPIDPFVLTMRRIEFESGRLLQAQIVFLKGPQLAPLRKEVAEAVERRHNQVGELWGAMLAGLGVGPA
jgi:hypothetical protein